MERYRMCSKSLNMRAAFNIFLIGMYFIIVLAFFYELFWGELNEVISKGLFYGITSIFIIYFSIEASIANKKTTRFQTVIIFFCSLAIVALICSTAMLSILKTPVLYMILYPGLVIISTFFALHHETRNTP